MPRDSSFKRSRVGVAFEPIPSYGEENPPNTSPSTFQFITSDGPKSVGKLSTSVFKDLMGSGILGPLLCVGFIIGIVTLFVIFIVPVLSGLFGFGSSVIGTVEGDVSSVLVTAGDIVKEGFNFVEDTAGVIINAVDSVACAWFHVECAPAGRKYICCEQFDPDSLAILIQRQVHISGVCKYNAIKDDWQNDCNAPQAPCRYGFGGINGRVQDYWPGTETSGLTPTQAAINNFMERANDTRYHVFSPGHLIC